MKRFKTYLISLKSLKKEVIKIKKIKNINVKVDIFVLKISNLNSYKVLDVQISLWNMLVIIM